MQLMQLNIPSAFDTSELPDFIDFLNNETEDYFVVMTNKKIIGCGGINYSKDGSEAIISWDMLHPDYQKMGVGSILMNYRLNLIMQNEKIREIKVRTSQMAYGFYARQGFELIEISKDFWAVGYDLYKMRMTL